MGKRENRDPSSSTRQIGSSHAVRFAGAGVVVAEAGMSPETAVASPADASASFLSEEVAAPPPPSSPVGRGGGASLFGGDRTATDPPPPLGGALPAVAAEDDLEAEDCVDPSSESDSAPPRRAVAHLEAPEG